MGLRRQQEQLYTTLLSSPRVLSSIKDVALPWAPASGKSWVAPIALHALRQRFGVPFKVCVAVPWITLQGQAEMAFLDGALRQCIGHDLVVRALWDGNGHNPSRDRDGYVVTHAGVTSNPYLHAQEFERAERQNTPYVLVVDEVHHLADDRSQGNAMRQLMDRAVFRIVMSGTPERHDGRRIVFWPYTITAEGEIPVVQQDDRIGTIVIPYSRKDALQDKNIIRAELYLKKADGVSFVYEGAQHNYNSFEEVEPQHFPRSLWTALNTEFAESLLDDMISDFEDHRRNYGHAQFMVVACSIPHGRQIVEYLKRKGVTSVGLATSHDSKEAEEVIKQFRERKLGGLVTVKMASEGADFPGVSHMAILTNIRSKPYIEQVIARGTRIDMRGPAYEEQFCRVYAPRDPKMLQVADEMRQDSRQAIIDRDEEAEYGGDAAPDRNSGDFRALSSVGGATSVFCMQTGDELSDSDSALLRQLREQFGASVSIEAFMFMRSRILEKDVAAPFGPSPETPAETEKRLRTDITTIIRDILRTPHGEAHLNANSIIKAKYGPRENMTEVELRQLKNDLLAGKVDLWGHSHEA